VLVTGANGCTASNTTTVLSDTAAPTGAGLSASNSGTLTCAVTTLTLRALPTGQSYQFSSGAFQIGASNQATVNAPGVYSVVITNANGCTATASVRIYQTGSGGIPTVAPLPSGTAVCEGVMVTVVATTSEPVTGYRWYRNGVVVTGQTSATLTLGAVTPAQAGSYVLELTGPCSSTSNAFVLTVNPRPVVTLVFPVGTSVGPGNPPLITLPSPLPSGSDASFGVLGALSYERTIIIDRINGFEIRQKDFSQGRFPLTRTGLFSITGTDANGCQQTVQGILNNLPAQQN
jgi:hypothetical protein